MPRKRQHSYQTESQSKINLAIRPMVNNLELLRAIEHDDDTTLATKFKLAKPLIDQTLDLLTKDPPNFLLHRPLWDELHDRMGHYFHYLNTYNLKHSKIPLIRTTLHNRFASWYYRGQPEKYGSILLHVDSHDDLQAPDPDGTVLPDTAEVDTEGMAHGACAQINFTATCLIMSKHVHSYLWLIPQWVYDNDYQAQQYLTYDHQRQKLQFHRTKNQPKDPYLYDAETDLITKKTLHSMQTDPSQRYQMIPFQLNRIHIEKSAGWKKVKRTLDQRLKTLKVKSTPKNRKFILNIDLDYFVTNGDKHSRDQYKQDFDDLQSSLRVHGLPGIRTPREMYTDRRSRAFAKRLDRERKAIDDRIVIFLLGLKNLKAHGYTPGIIGLAGSTPSFFSGDIETAVYTNNYTPKYFVPYIQSRLIKGFQGLYGKKSFL